MMTEQTTSKVKYLYYILPFLLFIIFFFVLISDEPFRLRCLWDSDINWILKTGEYIFTNNFNIPSGDIYSYTHTGKEWVVYQWLYEVFIYLIFSIGNYTSLGTFAALTISSVLLILYIIQRKLQVNPVYAILSILPCIILLKDLWYTRPAIITYLLTSIFILILIKAEKHSPKYLYVLPFIFLLWANLHLGFTFGITILSVYFLFNIFKRFILKKSDNAAYLKILIMCSILSILATLITPYNFELYSYMANLIDSPNMNSGITELLSPDFHKIKYFPYILMICMIIVLSNQVKKTNLFLLICLAITCSMSLSFIRNIPFFVIFAVPILGISLQNLHENILNSDKIKDFIKKPVQFIEYIQVKETSFICNDYKTNKFFINTGLIALFIIILLPLQNNEMYKNAFLFSMDYTKHRPYIAYKFARQYKIPGNLFTTPPWGSYAIAKLYPEYKTFVDTRFDMYGDEFFQVSYDILEAKPGWQKYLKKHNVNWIVLPINSLLASHIEKDPKKLWIKIYKDETAFIFIKNNKANKKWLMESDIINFKPDQ